MMILLPWLDNSAIKINDSIAVLLELNQFCEANPKMPRIRLNIPDGEESYSHSHTTAIATPDAMPGR